MLHSETGPPPAGAQCTRHHKAAVCCDYATKVMTQHRRVAKTAGALTPIALAIILLRSCWITCLHTSHTRVTVTQCQNICHIILISSQCCKNFWHAQATVSTLHCTAKQQALNHLYAAISANCSSSAATCSLLYLHMDKDAPASLYISHICSQNA